MPKKEEKKDKFMDEPCGTCGKTMKEQGNVAYEFQKGKKPICYMCKLEQMTPEAAKDFAKLVYKKYA